MEKLMQLVKVGSLAEREFKRQDGTVKKLQFRELLLSNGIDTIVGETSERLTAQTEANSDQLRLRLVEGHVYNCEFNLSVREAEKDGKKRNFMSCTITKLALIV